ncbi:LD-carboxypeptidase [candidate division KSB1 bacterium]|nr:LD-carboxypeptidase [candidate division KSB1 bacterium]RQV99954.1 MAG: LD-carboxypeptidase [candidate division KSB1 bacterium]
MFRITIKCKVNKPSRLCPGDTIGVVSPGGPLNPVRLQRLDLGINYLRQKGYQIIEGQYVREQTGYFAGTDQQRAADLNDMLRNKDVRAIFCSRGGYGVTRLFDQIDFDAARRDPKIIIGYSDVTALSLALFRQCRLLTFSGPLVAMELFDVQQQTSAAMWDVLSGAMPTFNANLAFNDWQRISPGVADGILLGGCLSMISPLLGTRFAPSFKNAILLLEDIGEDLYKIDRLFSHLKNAGILFQVNGIVLGHFVDLVPDTNKNPVEFDDIISYYCSRLQIPVISNFPYGHIPVKYTLPIGCRVRLDAGAGTIQLLEPGVI